MKLWRFPAGCLGVRRLMALALVFGLALTILMGTAALAQTGSPRTIAVGQTVTGSLSEQDFAQTFTFAAQAGDAVTIRAVSQSDGLTLAVLLVDAGGNTIGRAAALNNPEVTLANVSLPTTGAYYITVLRATGAQGAVAGEFRLSLTSGLAVAPTLAPSPTPVSLARGMSVSLRWGTIDDMDLEVRDPVGNAIFFRNPTLQSGVRLSSNVNNGCENTTSTATETITWSRGRIPTGSYEILVYFNRACRQPPAPVDFSVVITVDGNEQPAIQGRLNLNEQYVASFIVEGSSAVTVQPGGANPLLLNLTPFAAQINAPKPLGNRTEIAGRIDRNNQADVWSFDGTAGQIVSLDMSALSGSLDTQLILLGPDRNVIDSNDDATADTRNSLIANRTLPTTGNYLIVATRFGKNIGGTEGDYILRISRTDGTTPAVTPAPVGATPAPISTAQPTAAALTGTDPTTGLPLGIIAVTLSWNNRADLRLLIRDPEGRSLFSDNRQVPSGGTLFRQDNLACRDVTTTPITYAYWPGSRVLPGTYEVQVWLNNQCNEVILPTYTLTVNVNGTELIRRQDQPDINRNFFVTTFTIDPSGTVTAGPAGLFTQQAASDLGSIADKVNAAEALIYGRASVGQVDANAPFTVYTFQARGGDRVRITMRANRGNLDPFLYLLDSNGAQLARNDDASAADRNAQIDAVIPLDGRYTIVATRFGAVFGGTIGGFEIIVAPTR